MGQELAGKVAIVTGGASGIGRAMAELFVAEGAQVVVADIDVALGEEVVAQLGEGAAFRRTDVADRDQVEATVALAVARFGGLHVMCNNAGLPGRPIERFFDEDLQEWERIFAINVMGTTYGCQAAARHMAKAGGGSIINTASIAGVMPGFAYVGYRASKAAVINLTKSIAIDLAEYGIRVNALAPGAIKTPILDYREPGMTDEDTVRVRAVMDTAMMAYQPLKTQGRPSDVAEAALFLASDRSRQITGILLPVEGGITAGDPVNRSALIREGRERVLAEIRAERR
jgi:NAD(P)-dependent dehydrogenase (short-subunit alcohol dehydrogenase family)